MSATRKAKRANLKKEYKRYLEMLEEKEDEFSRALAKRLTFSVWKNALRKSKAIVKRRRAETTEQASVQPSEPPVDQGTSV